MSKNSKVIISPSSLNCFEGKDSFRAEYYSAEDINKHKRSVAWRALESWGDSEGSIAAAIASFFTAVVAGFITAVTADSGLLAIIVAAVTIVAINGLSFGKYFMREVKQKLPDSPSMLVTFCCEKTTVDRTTLAKAISENYEQQVISLLDGLNELRKSPSVGYGDFQSAERSVVSSLGVLGELASKDVLELWGGGNMPAEHQAIMDGLKSINGALVDMKEARD